MLMKFIKWFPVPIGWKARIACFFQSKFTVSSIVVIFNHKREVLLFHHTYRKNPWGLPGGYVNSREHPKTSIIREVFEEAGLKISKLKQISIKLDKDLARLIICYATKECAGKFRSSNEVSKVRYFPMSSLPTMTARQEEIIKKALGLIDRK